MKVLFDISYIGEVHREYQQVHRAGIYRVIDDLARGLAASGLCDFRLCASKELRLTHGCVDYLKQRPELSGRMMNYPRRRARLYHELSGRDGSLDSRTGMNPVLKTIARRGVRAARRFIEETTPTFGPSLLEWADIYHSPSWAISEQVRAEPRVRKVVTVHDLIPIKQPQFCPSDELVRGIVDSWRPDDWAFCISESTRRDLCEHLKLDGSRTEVVYWAASPELFYPVTDAQQIAEVRRKYRIPEGPYILCMSTLEIRKNIDHVIRAFVKTVRQEKINDLHLVLVGAKGWLYDKIFAELEASGDLRSRIVMPGYADNADLAPLLSGCLLFTYMSFYEGFGLPVLEAMQCGAPVVTSNTSSLPEVVGDGGIMLDPHDLDGLCATMLKVYRDSAAREDLGRRARERAQTFSWDRTVQQTVRAYEKVMKS